MTVEAWMEQARQQSASDLILVPGKPPCVYIHGALQALAEEPLTPDQLNALLQAFVPQDKRHLLTEAGDVDFAYGLPGIGRVRVNIHRQRGSCAAAMRFINTRIPSFEELNLPDLLSRLAQLPRGLVLVTGNTGSGKSTTLAAMVEFINHHLAKHVITLEDPIEYLFSHECCVIEQREIGEDAPSFAQALRHIVRQKPDIILIGEMRDRETIATALTASETGHLVLGTMHTNSAAQTVERVIDVFDPAHQPQIRVQLADTLQAVVCQALLRRKDCPGMLPALEIMIMTPAIRRAIRDSDTHLIPGMIETGQKYGMCTMDSALADLINAGVIGFDTAVAQAMDPERLQRLLDRPRPVAREVLGVARAERETDAQTARPAPPALVAGPAAKPWH